MNEQPNVSTKAEASPQQELFEQLAGLRKKIHAEMEKEIGLRLERNPHPTDEELRMAAFMEWIEPQVREAAREMYRKGYGTMSSGFYGDHHEFQAVDGYFGVDDATKEKLRSMGVEVLTGPELGLQNKLITQLRFKPKGANMDGLKDMWDKIAELLPEKKGYNPICTRAEEFREQYASDHPSLEDDIDKYLSQLQRDALAKEIKEIPKEKRRETLEKAKETPEYWQTRNDKIKERQGEEEIDNGLGVLFKKKTVYHGSGVSGIKQFNKAEEDTVGHGAYFTSEAKNSIGYARRRARREKDASPIIYESSVENIKLLDLRKDENVTEILEGFKQILTDKLLKEPNLDWNYYSISRNAIEAIKSKRIGAGNLREVTFSFGKMFSDYVQSLGYEGLVTIEGGEGEDVGSHDTYLIFDPEKAKIIQEHKIL